MSHARAHTRTVREKACAVNASGTIVKKARFRPAIFQLKPKKHTTGRLKISSKIGKNIRKNELEIFVLTSSSVYNKNRDKNKKMTETKQNKGSEEHGTDWKEKIEGYLGEFAKNLAGGFIERIKAQLYTIYVSAQKHALGMFLILVGFIFALIAIVIFINDLIKISNGVGYAVVGFFALIIGLIIIKK